MIRTKIANGGSIDSLKPLCFYDDYYPQNRTTDFISRRSEKFSMFFFFQSTVWLFSMLVVAAELCLDAPL